MVGQDLRCYGTEAGIPEKYATALAVDETGMAWFGSSAVYSWHKDKVQTFLDRQLKPSPVGAVSATCFRSPEEHFSPRWTSRALPAACRSTQAAVGRVMK